jgi:Tol biopolymer transport system component
VVLPGTLFVAQSGAIYSFHGGVFHQLTAEQGWMQPALIPDGGGLLAVKRSYAFSDVYELGLNGQVQRQLTTNAPARKTSDTGANHWSFYPRLTGDRKTLLMSYDDPKFGYEVDLSVWAVPFGGTIRQGRRWTTHNDYTGGDVQPLPLPTGGVLYTKYSLGSDGKMASQLWLTTRPLSVGTPLTTLDEDCSEPALSPDGKMLAMICSYRRQVSDLVLASFDGVHLGPRTVLIGDRVVAQPAWAPDGAGIAFLAPAKADLPFQLWWLPARAYVPSPLPSPAASGATSPGASATPSPVPVKPVAVTADLGFDATSGIAWLP